MENPRRLPASRLWQVVDQPLAAAPESGEHELLHAPVIGRLDSRSPTPHIHDGGVYPRRRVEDVRRDPVGDRRLGEQLYQHGVGRVVLGGSLGHHAPRDFQLHHEAKVGKRTRPLEQHQNEGRGHVVGQVGDQLVGGRLEGVVVEAEGVALVDPDVLSHGAAQGGEQVRVELHRVHEACSLGEKGGKENAAWAYLEHDVIPRHVRGYQAGGVGVLEEVLAEAFLGEGQRGCQTSSGRPKRLRALRVVSVASSSSSTPSRSATKRAVWTTFAGMFVSPRTGRGLRYGASVSTSSLSSSIRWRTLAV